MPLMYQRAASRRVWDLAVTAVVSLGIGLGLGWSSAGRDVAATPRQAEAPTVTAVAGPSTPPPTTVVPCSHQESVPPPMTQVPTGSDPGPLPSTDEEWRALESTNPDELTKRVQDDGTLAAAMAEQLLRGGVDPELRQFLASTLAQAQPALLERSAESLLHGPDSQARQQALDWLKDLPDPPKALAAAARQAALTEADPHVVASALEALRHSGGLSSTDADEAMVQQLRQYTTSTDPQVRRESVAGLVQADRTDSVEPILSRAMTDADPSVQIAAIGATVDAGIRSAEAKAKLFELSINPQMDPLVRSEALGALESFRLTPEEVARLAALQQG